MPFSPLGFQSVVAGTSGTVLTVPSGTRRAIIDTGGAILWRDDGSWNPAATAVVGDGIALALNDPPFVYNGDPTKLVFKGSGGTVNVSFHG